MTETLARKASRKRYYEKHREECLARCKEYYQLHKEESLEYHRKWREENFDKVRTYNNKSNKRARNRVIAYYSSGTMRCLCCDENTLEFLTIDHVNNNGAEHRRQIKREGTGLIQWLIKNDFPEGFQILCYNCNCAKRLNGICPHQWNVLVVE